MSTTSLYWVNEGGRSAVSSKQVFVENGRGGSAQSCGGPSQYTFHVLVLARFISMSALTSFLSYGQPGRTGKSRS